jgi:glycosyltransferase involved in cell wall biosynthesis
MDRVQASMLMGGVVERRVIPNGVDLEVFHPADKGSARERLDIPQDARVLLMVANRIRDNLCKDYGTLHGALERMIDGKERGPILFLGVGEEGHGQAMGGAEVRFVPFVGDPRDLARYYRAADLYVHAAKADTFPTTILEALACGLPVVATAVGGIPEQVRGLDGLLEHAPWADLNPWGPEAATGLLVPPNQQEALATALSMLLSDRDRLRGLGENATADARGRFGLDRQVAAYTRWYGEILWGRGKEISVGCRAADGEG